MSWPHKDLLCPSQLTKDQALLILKNAATFAEINQRAVKKVPTLKGRGVILFFAEASTRTKTSFDIAGKRLSADTFSLAKSGSSLSKGETLKDTVLTLQAMRPDAIVMRHWASGAASFIAQRLDCAVINAGDGRHGHPTQALLDAYTLWRTWGDLAGKRLLILGDIAHSRVARSNIILLRTLGAEVALCAPRTLLPHRCRELWPGVPIYHDLDEALVGRDAVMCLRLQLERMQAGLLPELSEYSKRFCLTSARLERANEDCLVMHPGPINRGVEIASDVADAAESLILDQVASGVAVRMAVLHLFVTRKTIAEKVE